MTFPPKAANMELLFASWTISLCVRSIPSIRNVLHLCSYLRRFSISALSFSGVASESHWTPAHFRCLVYTVSSEALLHPRERTAIITLIMIPYAHKCPDTEQFAEFRNEKMIKCAIQFCGKNNKGNPTEATKY